MTVIKVCIHTNLSIAGKIMTDFFYLHLGLPINDSKSSVDLNNSLKTVDRHEKGLRFNSTFRNVFKNIFFQIKHFFLTL